MDAGAHRAARAREIGRTLVLFAAVLGMTAVSLAVLNRVPEVIGSNPWRVRTAADLRAVEARFGSTLLVPAYFPQWLQWPPAAVRYIDGPPAGVAFTLTDRDSGAPALLVVQGLVAGTAVPPQLLRPGTLLDSEPVRVGEEPAVLTRVRLPDDSIWHELTWTEQDRPVVFRFRGHSGDVMRMARSLRKERP